MLRRDELIFELGGFFITAIHQPLDARGDVHLRGMDATSRCEPRTGLQQVVQPMAQLRHVDLQVLQDTHHRAVGLLQHG